MLLRAEYFMKNEFGVMYEQSSQTREDAVAATRKSAMAKRTHRARKNKAGTAL